MPDFVQVLEKPDLKKPGLIALLNFKVGSKVEAPTRVSLTRWPGVSLIWEIPLVPMAEDSAVAMYWNPRELKVVADLRQDGHDRACPRRCDRLRRSLALKQRAEIHPRGKLDLIAALGRTSQHLAWRDPK